jgi:gamma-glutamyltranspeptidase
MQAASTQSDVSGDVANALKRDGYQVEVWEFAFAGVGDRSPRQRRRVLMGAADPRRDGDAVGY